MTLRNAYHRLRRLWTREDGTAAVEFVILFPLFMTIMVSSAEAGLLMIRQAMLERGMDMAMRDLRLGRMEAVTPNTVRQRVCDNAAVIPGCENNLMVELRRLGEREFTLPDGTAPCVNRSEEVEPAVVFNPGAQHELMMVRACYIYDPIFPFSAFGLGLPLDASGGVRLATASVFVNEPR